MILQVGVKILIRDKAGHFLFLKRSSKFNGGFQMWDIPGGRIKPEEALPDALAREVSEETGLVLGNFSLLIAQDIFVEAKSLHVVRLTYTGTAEGDVVLSDEHDEAKWFSLDEIRWKADLDPYIKGALKAINEEE